MLLVWLCYRKVLPILNKFSEKRCTVLRARPRRAQTNKSVLLELVQYLSIAYMWNYDKQILTCVRVLAWGKFAKI